MARLALLYRNRIINRYLSLIYISAERKIFNGSCFSFRPPARKHDLFLVNQSTDLAVNIVSNYSCSLNNSFGATFLTLAR
jgi:hypothetical protein